MGRRVEIAETGKQASAIRGCDYAGLPVDALSHKLLVPCGKHWGALHVMIIASPYAAVGNHWRASAAWVFYFGNLIESIEVDMLVRCNLSGS